MKTRFLFSTRLLCSSAMVAASLLALAPGVDAKDKHKDKGKDKHHHDDRHDNDRDRDRDRVVYLSHPRSSFTLTLGNGYRGRGYYYGPPGAAYYYERPEVRYYSTRESAPREYWGSGYSSGGGSSSAASVQAALARRGYYRGPADGSLGPMSRRAIAKYQADNGMRPTGEISESLLRSLRL